MKKYIIFIVMVLLLTKVKAQEIGFSPVRIWTNNYEIQNQFGFSFYYFQPIGKLGFKIEYISAKNKRDYYGYILGGFFANPDEHIQENVKSKTNMSVLEFGLMIPEVLELTKNYFNIGFGVTRDRFSGKREGIDSGKEINIEDENKYGIFYSISISRKKVLQIPLKLELLFKQKFIKGGNFATDIEQPFVGSMIIEELHFNISYAF
jgi:hypothetical protein